MGHLRYLRQVLHTDPSASAPDPHLHNGANKKAGTLDPRFVCK
jgi:hypothetical protein